MTFMMVTLAIIIISAIVAILVFAVGPGIQVAMDRRHGFVRPENLSVNARTITKRLAIILTVGMAACLCVVGFVYWFISSYPQCEELSATEAADITGVAYVIEEDGRNIIRWDDNPDHAFALDDVSVKWHYKETPEGSDIVMSQRLTLLRDRYAYKVPVFGEFPSHDDYALIGTDDVVR